jgi:hypothetical protein
MTHGFRTRFLLTGASALAVLGLAVGTAVSASAGVTPSPSPTVTTPAPTPTPSVTPTPERFRLSPEAFILHFSTADPGSVFATGPVRGHGTDTQVNATDDTWQLTGPVGTFRVLHSPVGNPVVNPRTCTAQLDQRGRFVILGRHAFAFGTFRLREVVILARGRYGRCQVDAQPQWFDVQVLGVGQGAQLRGHDREPRFSPALLPVA